MLTNEKYVGNNIFNRQSFKLKKQRIDNPPEMWIRKVGAFEGIVPIEIFFTAQQILIARATQYSDQELLDKLRRLYQIKGWLTGLFIDEAPDLPSAATYSSRFGSLARAYEMVGFAPLRSSEHLEVNRRLRRLHPQIIERTQTSITELGGSVWRDPKTDLLHVNQELVVSLVMARCYPAAFNDRCREAGDTRRTEHTTKKPRSHPAAGVGLSGWPLTTPDRLVRRRRNARLAV